MGGQWSTYYYNGYIYGSEIARGTDVLKLVPTKYLTQNEIDAAAQISLPELNVQNQPHIDYPMTLLTAKAYLDQLARGNSLPADQIAAIESHIDAKNTKKLHADAKRAEKAAAAAKTPVDAVRLSSLSIILKSDGTPGAKAGE
jgi:tRNA A37 N6-isopentenylltransferase MiaA